MFFATPSSVYRHLTKAHHRNEQQIRRLRSQILSKASERKLLQSPTKIMSNLNGELRALQKEKEQWSNNFEGALRCGSCRKSFNRRAVLSVHLASCKERIAEQTSPKPVQTVQQPQKPEAAIKPTSLLKVSPLPKLPLLPSPPPLPKPVPKIDNKNNPTTKSGIIVRKDYCKNSSSSSNSISSPSATNCFYTSDRLQVVVKKLEEKNILELQKSMNGSDPLIDDKTELRTEKIKRRKVEKTDKSVRKSNKAEKIGRDVKKEPEPEKEIKPNENNEKDGSLTPEEASIKSERLSPVESVSSTVSSNRTNPYKLRKKKTKSDDDISLETASTEEAEINPNNVVVNNETLNDSNIETEESHSVEKVDTVLRRTNRARTAAKKKEFVYNNIKRISPTANKCRAKSIKKAVKHLNYNGSMLLMHKNLSLLKNRVGVF